MIKGLKFIFKSLQPAWCGPDGKISVRASLAIMFSIDFVKNLSHAIWKWDAGTSLEGLSLVLGIEASLIVALLGLTTYQNMNANVSSTKTVIEKTQQTVDNPDK